MCKIEHLKNRSELFRTVEWKGDILYVLLIDTSIFMMQKKITKMLKYFDNYKNSHFLLLQMSLVLKSNWFNLWNPGTWIY